MRYARALMQMRIYVLDFFEIINLLVATARRCGVDVKTIRNMYIQCVSTVNDVNVANATQTARREVKRKVLVMFGLNAVQQSQSRILKIRVVYNEKLYAPTSPFRIFVYGMQEAPNRRAFLMPSRDQLGVFCVPSVMAENKSFHLLQSYNYFVCARARSVLL